MAFRHRRTWRAEAVVAWRVAPCVGAGQEEAGLRTKTQAYGASKQDMPPNQPHFGLTIVTCAGGEMRASKDGVLVYGHDGLREIALPRGEGMPGRQEVLDDMTRNPHR